MSASAFTPDPDPRKDSLIQYPSKFPIKVMGAKVDGFVNAVTTIARQFDPEFDASTVELRDSSNERLAAVVANRKGDKNLQQGEQITWAHLQEISDYWSRNFRHRLDAARSGK